MGQLIRVSVMENGDRRLIMDDVPHTDGGDHLHECVLLNRLSGDNSMPNSNYPGELLLPRGYVSV